MELSEQAVGELQQHYIHVVKEALMDGFWDRGHSSSSSIARVLRENLPSVFGHASGDRFATREGRAWPEFAFTMIGEKRLDNIRFCVEQIISDKIEGDLIETGVWRGGACIFMRALLLAYGVKDRAVWLADSFEGLPPPNPSRYPKDRGDKHHKYDELRVSLEAVKSNFAAFGLLDDQARFLQGWFKDTLQDAPIDRLAVCRLDGDMYESTMDALTALYPKLQNGGFLIVDDYGAVPACKQAVIDYRQANSITDKLIEIDWSGVYWRKEK